MKVLLIIMVGIIFTLIPMAHASTEILNIETSIVDDVMFIKTSIENTEQQKVLITIYVESDDQVPLGVMFFKTQESPPARCYTASPTRSYHQTAPRDRLGAGRDHLRNRFP